MKTNDGYVSHLDPYRHVLLRDDDDIIWAPSLRGAFSTRNRAVHAILQSVLPALAAGRSAWTPDEALVVELLRDQGYVVDETIVEPPSAPVPARALTQTVLLVSDGPTGQALIEQLAGTPLLSVSPDRLSSVQDWSADVGIAALDAFSVASFGRIEPFLSRCRRRVYALAGDGEEAWIYACREHPCLTCFLGRWLAGLTQGDEAAPRVAAERELRWRSPLAPAAMAASIRSVVENFDASVGQARFLTATGTECETFLPVPRCMVCRPGPEATTEAWLGGRLGLVKTVREWPSRAAVPVSIYSASLGAASWATGGKGATVGSGCHWTAPAARHAAVGEALERYAASCVARDVEWHVVGPPWDSEYVQGQYDGPRTQLPCLRVERLCDGSSVLAPMSRVLLRYERMPGEPWLFPSLSHGLACGIDRGSALLGALTELIERDAAALFWARLPLGTSGAWRIPWEDACRSAPALATLEPMTLLGLPCLAGLSTVMAIGRDRIATGTAAGADMRQVLEKAVLECVHNRCFLEDRPDSSTSDPPDSFEAHAAYYWHNPQEFDMERIETLPSGPLPSPSPVDVAALVDRLESSGHPAYYRDLSPPDVVAAGFCVVRALVPSLLYLPASHDAWPLGRPRWRAEVGNPHLTRPLRPHPFA